MILFVIIVVCLVSNTLCFRILVVGVTVRVIGGGITGRLFLCVGFRLVSRSFRKVIGSFIVIAVLGSSMITICFYPTTVSTQASPTPTLMIS